MALSIITDKFRIENAKKFVQSMTIRDYPNDFSTAQSNYERVKSEPLNGAIDNMYMIIGKITSWYTDGTETPVPDTGGFLRQESEIWSNALAAKRIDTTNISHVTFRENWTINTEYPYYQSTESNTTTFSSSSTPNFFVLDENEFRIYKCLFNNYGGLSSVRPTDVGGVGGDARRIQREPFYTSDGYLWKYMYTIDPSAAVKFLTESYMPVRKDLVNDDGSSDDNRTVDGAIYRIFFPAKSNAGSTIAITNEAASLARVRVEGINSGADVTVSGLTIDMSNTDNQNRIATIEDDDMIGYQVEHIIDDGTKTVEVAEIVDSSFASSTLTLTIKRLDDTSKDSFTVPGSGTETWFISPLVRINGEGKDASALLYINGEQPEVDASSNKLFPIDPVNVGDAVDILMNTVGFGYRNVYDLNDFSGTLDSIVELRQGKAKIGNISSGDTTQEQDRSISNVAEVVSVTPYGGHSFDNVSELYAYTIMISSTFSGDESGSATVQNDFRQISLMQNPIELDGTLADSLIYRQTVRIEFDGNITGDINYDDEISDQSTADDDKTLFGRVVRWEYNSTDDKTLVYLSSSYGLLTRTAQEVYDINPTHTLYLSIDVSSGTPPYTPFTISSRITGTGDGEYQRGLSDSDDRGLEFLSGDLFYTENRQPVIRAADQSESIKLVIEY